MSSVLLRLNLDDERVLELVKKCYGVPYVYGAGKPADAMVGDWWLGVQSALPNAPRDCPRGFDCSGFVQVALVRLGMLSKKAGDRGAAALYGDSLPVPEGGAVLGDLAFYGQPVSHVMLCLGGGLVYGASGAGAGTWGNNPAGFVKLDRVHYRTDFRGIRRLPVEATTVKSEAA